MVAAGVDVDWCPTFVAAGVDVDSVPAFVAAEVDVDCCPTFDVAGVDVDSVPTFAAAEVDVDCCPKFDVAGVDVDSAVFAVAGVDVDSVFLASFLSDFDLATFFSLSGELKSSPRKLLVGFAPTELAVDPFFDLRDLVCLCDSVDEGFAVDVDCSWLSTSSSFWLGDESPRRLRV